MLTIEYGVDGTVVVVGRLDAAQSSAAQGFLDKVQGLVTVDCSRLECRAGSAAENPETTARFRGKTTPGGRQPAPAGRLPVFGIRPDLRDRARRLASVTQSSNGPAGMGSLRRQLVFHGIPALFHETAAFAVCSCSHFTGRVRVGEVRPERRGQSRK